MSSSITDSKELLMVSLTRFYAQKSNMTKILPILQGKADVSLRLIDWFITNYAKKHSTIITHVKQNNIIHFNVYLSYRSQLKAYSKHLFDPFRRRDRITFFYERDKAIDTTIAQLNVFRWLLLNNILEYIDDHKKEIEEDMIKTQKRPAAAAAPTPATAASRPTSPSRPAATATTAAVTKQKKRVELSRAKLKNMNTFAGALKLNFE